MASSEGELGSLLPASYNNHPPSRPDPMDPIFKELTKLESLSVPSSSSSKKAKTSSSASSSAAPALSVTLDGLIAALVSAQSRAASPTASDGELNAIWAQLEREIAGSKDKVDEVSLAHQLRSPQRSGQVPTVDPVGVELIHSSCAHPTGDQDMAQGDREGSNSRRQGKHRLWLPGSRSLSTELTVTRPRVP